MVTTQATPSLVTNATRVTGYHPISDADRVVEYEQLMSRPIRSTMLSDNKKDAGWDQALRKFRSCHGRNPVPGDVIPRTYFKIRGTTAPDNLACIAGRQEVPLPLRPLHLFPMPEGRSFRMIDLDAAFFELHSADQELVITMPRPDMATRTDQDGERAAAELLFDSTAMHILTGIDPALPFVNRCTGRSQLLSTKGRPFTYTVGGQTFTSTGTRVEIDELRYAPSADLALVLEFKRGALPNHLPRRQLGYAALAAHHLPHPAGQIISGLVVVTDPLFVDTPAGRHYADIHHFYIHWFDIPADNLDAAKLIQVDKVTLELHDTCPQPRPTQVLSPAQRLSLTRALVSPDVPVL